MNTILNDICTRAAEIAGPNSTATRQLEIQYTLDDARRHERLVVHYKLPMYSTPQHIQFAELLVILKHLV